jgi:hypothetical protein
MTDTPRRRSDVHARLVDGEVVVLDRKTDLVHQLNATASFIWQRCDGRATRHDMAAQLVEAFEVDADTATAAVASALEQLARLGLLESPGTRTSS